MTVRDLTTYLFFVPLGIGLTLGYVGAFETGDRLDGYSVLTYWLPSVWVAWIFIGLACLTALRLLQPWRPPLLVSVAAGCALASVAISAEYVLYETAFFPQLLSDSLDPDKGLSHAVAVYFPMVLPVVFLVALPINLYFWRRTPSRSLRLLYRPNRERPAAATPAPADRPQHTPEPSPATSPLFARLPPSLGTDVLNLEAQQHYLKVTTSKGSAVILYRLSDAVEDLKTVDGLRVHRSYWVSRTAVQGTERENGRLWLKLSTGLRVPVSRSYQLAAKHAGLLEQVNGNGGPGQPVDQ